MRVLLVGASGFIGSAVLARLREEGHEVLAVTRSLDAASQRLGAHLLVLDLRQATSPDHWLPHLAGIDAVVNCAGVLQDSARDSTSAAHVDGVAALFAACERAGVRRVAFGFPAFGAVVAIFWLMIAKPAITLWPLGS